jgi:hypothetical protein
MIGGNATEVTTDHGPLTPGLWGNLNRGSRGWRGADDRRQARMNTDFAAKRRKRRKKNHQLQTDADFYNRKKHTMRTQGPDFLTADDADDADEHAARGQRSVVKGQGSGENTRTGE